MTDDHPTRPDPDRDPFERELAALLRDRAAGPVPARLAAAVDDAVRLGGPGPRFAVGRRFLATLVAAVVAVVLFAATVGSLPTDPDGIGDPGTASSPGTVPAPIAWDNGHVRLEADALVVTARGRTFEGHGANPGTVQVPDSVLWRDQLEVGWSDGPERIRLTLDFRRDHGRWWITEGTVILGDLGYATFTDEALRAPIGRPFTGDIALRGTLVTMPDGIRRAGSAVTLRFRNLRLQPFRAAVARTMDGCRPVIDPDVVDSTTSPMGPGQPLARHGLVGLPAVDAAAAVEASGYCYLFERRLSVDPTLGASGANETWCDPPPGIIHDLRYGRGGELRLVIVEQVARGTPARVQPILGHGCRVAGGDGPAPSSPPVGPSDGCQSVRDLRPGTSDFPAAPGQPLDGLDVIGRPAQEVAAMMQRLGYCHGFWFHPADPDTDPRARRGERWCDPPPGVVTRATYGDAGEASFTVVGDEPSLVGRSQPPAGWGCRSEMPEDRTPGS